MVLETSVEIDASAEHVWAVLIDFRRYQDWNPFIRRIDGVPERASRLRVEVAAPGGRRLTFRTTVLKVEPGRELRWKAGPPIPGLFDSEHYLVITRLAAARAQVLHGEIFSGLCTRLVSKQVRAAALASYQAMNAALKERAEGMA